MHFEVLISNQIDLGMRWVPGVASLVAWKQPVIQDIINLNIWNFYIHQKLKFSNHFYCLIIFLIVATYDVPPDTGEPQPEMLYEDMSGLMNDMDDDDDTSENELMYEEMTIPSPPPG